MDISQLKALREQYNARQEALLKYNQYTQLVPLFDNLENPNILGYGIPNAEGNVVKEFDPRYGKYMGEQGYLLDYDRWLEEKAPKVSGDYNKSLRDALLSGVDLSGLGYGSDWYSANKFLKEVGGRFDTKNDSFMPANPVGYQGGYKFDPNFGSGYYRELAMQVGQALGLSPEQILKIGSNYTAEVLYDPSGRKAALGFDDIGKGLVDRLVGARGLDVNDPRLKPLYDANDNLYRGLNDAARIESNSSGFFKGIGESIAKLGPIGTIALTAALGPAGAGLSTSLATGIAAATPGLLQGNIEGAVKSGLFAGIIPGIVGGAATSLNQTVSNAVGGGTLGEITGNAAKGALQGGVSGLFSGGNVAQGLLTGALGGSAGGIGDYVGSQIGGDLGSAVGAGLGKGLGYEAGGRDFAEGFAKGAIKDVIKNGGFNNPFPNFELPKFDFSLPSTGGLGFKLPDFNFDLPKFDFNLPDTNFNLPSFKLPNFNFDLPNAPKFNLPNINAPDFNLPNINLPNVNLGNPLQGKPQMNDLVSSLFSSQGLSALLSGLGTKDQIDKLREVGAQGNTLFSNIANEAKQGTEFKPYNVTSSIGSTQYNPATGQFGSTLNPALQSLFNKAGAAANTNLEQYNNPLLSSLSTEALQGARGALGSAMGSTQDQAQNIYNLRQQIQQPTLDRQALELENRLRAQGRLGQTTAAYGGAPEQLAFQKAIAEQRSSDTLSSLLNAEQLASSALQRGQGMFDLGRSAIMTPEAINAQRAQTAGALQGLMLAPEQVFGNQMQTAGQMTANQARQGLDVNQLIANLRGQGGMLPLQAESVASNLRAEQLKAIAQALGSNNAISSGVNSVGQSLAGVVNQGIGALGGLLGQGISNIGNTIGQGVESGLGGLFGNLFSNLPDFLTGDEGMLDYNNLGLNTQTQDWYSEWLG